MKRMKVPDYKEKSVFGVPLIIHVQRCGFPLPLCLQQALSHLRTHCLDQVRPLLQDSLTVCAFLLSAELNVVFYIKNIFLSSPTFLEIKVLTRTIMGSLACPHIGEPFLVLGRTFYKGSTWNPFRNVDLESNIKVYI